MGAIKPIYSLNGKSSWRGTHTMTDNKRHIIDQLSKGFTFVVTLLLVFLIIFLILFVFWRGMAPFTTSGISLRDFLTGDSWRPAIGVYGVGYMIVASLLATTGAVLLGTPIAIFTAVLVVELLPTKLRDKCTAMITYFSAVPSLIYGLFGFGFVLPIIASISPHGSGESLLAVILVLAMMVVPTISLFAIHALRAAKKAYHSGGLALGASPNQNVFKLLLPAAMPGIITGILLATGRAIGETMAVMLVAGNPEGGLPRNIFDRVRLLTTNVVLEQGYASGTHEKMLFSTVLVLFGFILIIQIIFTILKKRWERFH